MPIAFFALGFLIGNLTALSASPIAAILVPSLFTFMGGSVLAFFSKIHDKDRPVVWKSILSFSLACLAGIYIGIELNSRQLLGPIPFSAAKSSSEAARSYLYLREADPSAIDAIDQRV